VADAHKNCVSAKCALEQLLEDFERGRDRSIAVQQRLMMLNKQFQSSLEEFSKHCNDFRWNKKLAALQNDEKMFDHMLKKELGALFQQNREEEDRNKLLGGRRGDDEYEKSLAHSMKDEANTLANSSRMVNDMLASGANIITGLKGNQAKMKGAHRKALDVVNQIGVSAGLLNTIGSKEAQDRAIVYGCMAFTLVLFFVLYYFFKM